MRQLTHVDRHNSRLINNNSDHSVRNADVMLMAVPVPPPPWTWWMRSPIVRLLLTDPRYDNVKRALQSIMSTRHRLTKNANQHHHHRPRASVP